ncbi:MAG: hypothetical protein PHQ75_14140 [Thermoguttaceae bacterium]|nr:hypothetical protein [Thermoguttaceae bacterium]
MKNEEPLIGTADAIRRHPSESMLSETPADEPAELKSEELVAQATRRAEAFKSKMEDAEAKIIELESKLAAISGDEPQGGTGELREKLDKVLAENTALLANQPELERVIKQLKVENEQFRRQVVSVKIKEALHEEAKRLGIRAEAIRDVERLAPEFIVNDSGEVVSSNGRSVHEILDAEKALSPHWLPASRGGGSFPGNISQNGNELFEQARLEHDLRAMIAHAPTID